MKDFYKNKTILITGGTGSLGKALIKRLKNIGVVFEEIPLNN